MENKEIKVAFNLKEASAYIGVSYPTMLNIMRTGEIPSRRIGKGRWLISREALDSWLKSSDSNCKK